VSPSRRRPGKRERMAAAEAPPEPRRDLPPLPEWRWRTFPVFAAAAVAAFLGVYIGGIAAFAGTGPFTVVSIITALPVGLALSRLVTRFMMTRRLIKPRARSRATRG
jgi:hypothetical protein